MIAHEPLDYVSTISNMFQSTHSIDLLEYIHTHSERQYSKYKYFAWV